MTGGLRRSVRVPRPEPAVIAEPDEPATVDLEAAGLPGEPVGEPDADSVAVPGSIPGEPVEPVGAPLGETAEPTQDDEPVPPRPPIDYAALADLPDVEDLVEADNDSIDDVARDAPPHAAHGLSAH